MIVGKHFIVTGGTSGLGLEITKELLKKGAYITLIVRSTEKFENINFNPYKHRVSMIIFLNLFVIRLTESFIVQV